MWKAFFLKFITHCLLSFILCRGTSGIDIDLRRVDIDQCPQRIGVALPLNIFAGTDKCKARTTEVIFNSLVLSKTFLSMAFDFLHSILIGGPMVNSIVWKNKILLENKLKNPNGFEVN